MQTYLIAALSADGYIAENKTQTSTRWTSKEDSRFFQAKTKQARVIVMGRTTYETIGRTLPGRLNIIYSSLANDKSLAEAAGYLVLDEATDTAILNETQTQPVVTTLAPTALVKKLEAAHFTELAICGGSSIYTLWLQAGLIDQLYLTIEPIVFGDGIRLFNQSFGEAGLKLSLNQVQHLSDQTLVLNYSLKREV